MRYFFCDFFHVQPDSTSCHYRCSLKRRTPVFDVQNHLFFFFSCFLIRYELALEWTLDELRVPQLFTRLQCCIEFGRWEWAGSFFTLLSAQSARSSRVMRVDSIPNYIHQINSDTIFMMIANANHISELFFAPSTRNRANSISIASPRFTVPMMKQKKKQLTLNANSAVIFQCGVQKTWL